MLDIGIACFGMAHFSMTLKRLANFKRDMRSSATGIRLAHRFRPQRRLQTFAQGIIDRYQGGQGLYRRLSLVFVGNRSGVTFNPVYHNVQMCLRARLSLAVLRQTDAPAPSHPLNQKVATQLLRQSVVLPVQIYRQIETLVYQLNARRIRLDGVASTDVNKIPVRTTLTASPEHQQATDFVWDVARPVPRIIRKMQVTPHPEANEASQMRRSPSGYKEFDSSSKPSPFVGTHSMNGQMNIDLNRLTDQVVQAIDHRIIAYRERLGRI